MAFENDLIVVDEDYTIASRAVDEYCTFLNKAIHNYVLTMDAILDEAVKDELISKKLKQLVEQVRPMVSTLEGIQTSLYTDIAGFITEIDDTDNFLY